MNNKKVCPISCDKTKFSEISLQLFSLHDQLVSIKLFANHLYQAL